MNIDPQKPTRPVVSGVPVAALEEDDIEHIIVRLYEYRRHTREIASKGIGPIARRVCNGAMPKQTQPGSQHTR